jgi:hypothetical protein
MEIKSLERKQGYGLLFNNLFVAGDTLIKQAKNQYGVNKIKKEIESFFLYDKTKKFS